MNGKVLANRKAWEGEYEDVKFSDLGDSGKVLCRKKTMLVTPDIWKNSKEEIKKLSKEGYKIGCLPFVNPKKQKYTFTEGDIDGHSKIIENKNGDLNLVVADSYSLQGDGTKKLIKRAAETIEAEMIEVDDTNLPPLALNLIQFEDGSIALTNSEAGDLEFTLEMLVGSDKIFKTDVPIVNIPKNAHGGIGCLTNIFPPILYSLLLKCQQDKV